MAANEVAIYNLALSAIGARSSVAAVDEATREAQVANLWYEEVRDQVLQMAPWSSTTTAKRLTLSVERDPDEDWVATDPEPGWRFAYEAPADMLRPRHLSNWDRFQVSTNSSGAKIIQTQTEEAILIYSKVSEVVVWDANLTLAMVYALASHIALPLQGKPERARHLLEIANLKAMEARVDAANEGELQFESMPEWITARGFSGHSPASRFMYPYGPLLSATGGIGVQ